MSSVRKSIRNNLVDDLKGKTDAGTRVYPNRVKPAWQSELPIILVYTRTEDVSVFAESGPREYQRDLTLSVEIILEGGDDIDDDLDVVAEQVESAVYESFENGSLNQLCDRVDLSGVEMNIDKDGQKLFGSCILNYMIQYRTEAVIDSDTLEWLERVDTEYDVSSASADWPSDTVSGLES